MRGVAEDANRNLMQHAKVRCLFLFCYLTFFIIIAKPHFFLAQPHHITFIVLRMLL